MIAKLLRHLVLAVMLAAPSFGVLAAAEILGVNTTGTVVGATITPSTTANTKGSWITVGTTTQACNALTIFIRSTSSANVEYLIDIGEGATPNVVVPNIGFSVPSPAGANEDVLEITIPASVATSTAIKARSQSSGGTASGPHVSVVCHGTNPFHTTSISAFENYGANTADSAGVSIDPGGTSHTKGSYAEITSSTSATIEAFWVVVQNGNGDFNRADNRYLLDIATGAAASETNIIENLPFTMGSAIDTPEPRVYGPFVNTITSGTRLSARMQSDSTTAGNRVFDVMIIGASDFDAADGSGTDDVLGVGTGSTTTGVTVTANASANTKGSYATIGTTTQACEALTIIASNFSISSSLRHMIDIATGATPDIIVDNLMIATSNGISEEQSFRITFPLSVATSTDIKARTQADTGSSEVDIAVICHETNPYNTTSVTAMDTYGANTADSGGASTDAGGSADTKGSYVEIDASTGAAIEGLWWTIATDTDWALADEEFLMDLATGAASSEVNFLENIPHINGGQVDGKNPKMRGPLVQSISSSTRLAARAQASTTLAGNRVTDVVLYGASSFSQKGGGGGSSVPVFVQQYRRRTQ